MDILRSILGFLLAAAKGNGTIELQRGHLGLLLEIKTYIKQVGHPVAHDAVDFWSTPL